MEVISTSPDDEYDVHAAPWEAAASQWVYTPSIVRRSDGTVLYRPADEHWSVDRAEWSSAHHITLTLRRFPGNHMPEQVSVSVDLGSATARVDNSAMVALPLLDVALAAAVQDRR